VFDRKDPRKLLSRTDSRSSRLKGMGESRASAQRWSSLKGWLVRGTAGFFLLRWSGQYVGVAREPCSERRESDQKK